jgi:hypothetical protein
MTPTARHLSLATALILLAGCDPEPQRADDELQFRCTPIGNTCGPIGNTPFTGSLNLSPLDTQGDLLHDIVVDKVVLAGTVELDEFWAHEGQLFGSKGETLYSGVQFSGAAFHLTAWGDPIVLRIGAATPPPIGEPFWLYLFQWEDGLGGTDPACEPTGTGDLRALVHDDLVIDPGTGAVSARANTVYIACLRGAAGEAAYRPLGYGFRPFEHGFTTFAAAMRFLRADYCGDGKSWTEYGEQITYLDKWGVSSVPLNGHTDAVWGMQGALCIGEDLRAGHTYADIQCDTATKPPQCSDVEAKALYLSQGRLWSKTP